VDGKIGALGPRLKFRFSLSLADRDKHVEHVGKIFLKEEPDDFFLPASIQFVLSASVLSRSRLLAAKFSHSKTARLILRLASLPGADINFYTLSC
jgi:hypothetical protein